MMDTGLAQAKTPHAIQSACLDGMANKLEETNELLVIMPTGAGKTWTMGFHLADVMPKTIMPHVLVLQDRRKVLKQNRATIAEATAGIMCKTSLVMGRHNDWSGDIVFGSAATLARPRRLKSMPYLTHILVDEAHHMGAAGFKRLIAHARAINPDIKILKFTATPNRADGDPIATPDEVAYQVTYAECIDEGILVPVRTMTIDLGLRKAFEGIEISGDEYDMATLGTLLNKKIHHQSVVDHWIEQGGPERNRTVAFCPTIEHARALTEVFEDNGFVAACVHSEMDEDDIDAVLADYDAGRYDVLMNCMMLTEGWDSPETDCIINLRMMVAELTFLQAVGRGMRAAPGKTDCLLLDFTGAAVRHGSIETRVLAEREAQVRTQTHAHPANDNDGCHRDRKPPEVIREFAMREIDIMRQSKPRFVEVPGKVPMMIAVCREHWAGVACIEGMWHTITRKFGEDIHVSACTTANEAMVMADRFLLALGDPRRNFEMQPVTYKQDQLLTRYIITDPQARKSRYDAACFIAEAQARGAIKNAFQKNGYLKIRKAA